MTTRYVGPGGNDGNSGLTWALRKLTLNGVEDTPVVAGDLVWVGPGVYRETLTCDVDGGAGTEIVYIGDVTGEHTDGVGGVVRITGSDNDTTRTRNTCITSFNIEHRIFRGFRVDMAGLYAISINGNGGQTDWIIEDCVFSDNVMSVRANGAGQANITARRCAFINLNENAVLFSHSANVDDAGHLLENCLMVSTKPFAAGLRTERVGGITCRNLTIMGLWNGVLVAVAQLTPGQTVIVENSFITNADGALVAINVGEIVEDYNSLWDNNTDRTNTNTGANSVAYPALVQLPILHSGVGQISGFEYPWWFGELSEWSQIQAITGSNEPTEDLRGVARPVTVSKNSWGPAQFHDMERETGTVRTGSVSMAIRDAGRHQIWVPVTATSTTIQVYVYREANYAGLLPQMIIKQPGQADDITTDVGAAGGWNLLTTTLVPAALPPYVVVELVSRNTNGAADEVFFDDLDVS